MEDVGLYLLYFLFIVAVGLAVVMPIVNAVKTPGSITKALYGFGGLLVLGTICFAIASPEVTPQQAAVGVTGLESRIIGAGLALFYTVFGLAIIGLIYSEINKALK